MAALGARRRRRRELPALADLVGSDVEVRLANGAAVRGELRSASGDFLALARASDGRAVLVARSAVVTVVDELAPGLRTASRRGGTPASEGGGDEL